MSTMVETTSTDSHTPAGRVTALLDGVAATCATVRDALGDAAVRDDPAVQAALADLRQDASVHAVLTG